MTTLDAPPQSPTITTIATADIVVYGDAAVGVTAAVQGTRMGKSVILVSNNNGHLGGMTSSGLGWTDLGNAAILGGLSREFYHRVYLYYQNPAAWNLQKKSAFCKQGQGGAATFDDKTQLASVFEPKVAEAIFNQMIAQAGVRVIKGRLDLTTTTGSSSTTMNGKRITAIHLQDGRTVQGKMFIDASYEGDLLAAVVTFTVGREANAHYGETSNGITSPTHSNNLPRGIDPYNIRGDPKSGLLPGTNPSYDIRDVGKADHRLQSYCYRMCLTDFAPNCVRITRPANYNEADYELLFRAIQDGKQSRDFFKTSPMPNFKTDSNNIGGVSCDFIGRNYSPLPPHHADYWDWTTLNHTQRETVANKHRDWQLGLVWTLQHHPRVPKAIQDRYAPWGLPKDEFIDNDSSNNSGYSNWPYNIYVRSGRRMVSDFVMTEHQCRQNSAYPQVNDSIGMGAYAMDSHNVQRVVYNNQLKNEGDVQRSLGGHPYPISYRAIVPATGECENLLVPWCLSSSHIAFGSIRMEPVGMVLGQSAATAAALAIDGKIAVQDVAYSRLKERLLADGQILYESPIPERKHKHATPFFTSVSHRPTSGSKSILSRKEIEPSAVGTKLFLATSCVVCIVIFIILELRHYKY